MLYLYSFWSNISSTAYSQVFLLHLAILFLLLRYIWHHSLPVGTIASHLLRWWSGPTPGFMCVMFACSASYWCSFPLGAAILLCPKCSKLLELVSLRCP